MQVIPINDTPSQTLNVALNGQNCRIDLYTRTQGLCCDLYINDSLIIGGVICQNVNFIVRDSYLGFLGDLMFVDTQSSDDPSSPGLGSRYVFMYLTPADISAAGL